MLHRENVSRFTLMLWDSLAVDLYHVHFPTFPFSSSPFPLSPFPPLVPFHFNTDHIYPLPVSGIVQYSANIRTGMDGAGCH